MSESNFMDQISCPLPEFDFDVITLGHGSGGMLTHKLLDAGVFTVLGNDYLNRAHDGAFLQLDGKYAFTTDSFVVSPIFFPGGNIGDLAVHGTVNDVAMCGAIPNYLSLSFILEEGMLMTDFAKILQSIQIACAHSGIQIVTGDTKVVEKGKGDQIFINTTGLGPIHPKAHIDIQRIQTGDVILVSGPIASHGVAILSVRQGLEFETELKSDSTNLNGLVKLLLDECGDAIRFFRDPTRGGVSSTLNEITRNLMIGIQLDERQLPFEDAVEGACEMLGLDPLYVANEGIFITIIDRAHAAKALEIMRQHPKGTKAAMIGEIVADHPGQVVLNSRIGGRRIVQMLLGEQLPRIC